MNKIGQLLTKLQLFKVQVAMGILAVCADFAFNHFVKSVMTTLINMQRNLNWLYTKLTHY